jgi:2-hydroxychromene-2-carboxylate isomerase
MQAEWFFDFVSPFSYLQLAKTLRWRERIEITPVPIAFGAVLNHTGTLGPAEVHGKREFMYRFIVWQAEHDGITLRFPPAHPFNPLMALRLCVAAGSTWDAVEKIFTHIWRDGNAGVTADDLTAIAASIGIDDVAKAANAETVKARLRTNTDRAIAAGVFGVPTLRSNDEIFWGNDASPMIDDWLDDPARFDSAEYRRVATLPKGVERKR